MRTINITNKQKFEVFLNPNNDEYEGFVGYVQVYNEEIYIDTRNGKGYDILIKKLNKLIKHLSFKYNFNGWDIEDIQQTIIVYILEGLPKYDPRRNTKLSTFLQMLITRRLINDIRNQSRDIRNSTTLNITLYSIKCYNCNNKIIKTMDADYEEAVKDEQCNFCGLLLENATIHPVNIPTISMEQINMQDKQHNRDNRMTWNDVISDNSFDIPLVYDEKVQLEDAIMSKDTFYKLLESEDKKMQELLILICLKDYSVASAAKELGLSYINVSNKIKRLKRKQLIKDIYYK